MLLFRVKMEKLWNSNSQYKKSHYFKDVNKRKFSKLIVPVNKALSWGGGDMNKRARVTTMKICFSVKSGI